MKIVFRNLKKSELVTKAVKERLDTLLEKFPSMKSSNIVCTLDMDNSPVQVGRDVFRVKIKFKSGQYKGIVLEKEAITFYQALAEVVESLHERLRRADEKRRTLERSKGRQGKFDPSIIEMPSVANLKVHY